MTKLHPKRTLLIFWDYTNLNRLDQVEILLSFTIRFNSFTIRFYVFPSVYSSFATRLRTVFIKDSDNIYPPP